MPTDRIDDVHTFDWYDGVVLAIVQPTWTPRKALATLLAWDQHERRRVYALLEIDDSDVLALKQLCDNWPALIAEVRRRFAITKSDVCLACVSDQDDIVLEKWFVSASSVSPYAASDAGEALDASRASWFRRTPSH